MDYGSKYKGKRRHLLVMIKRELFDEKTVHNSLVLNEAATQRGNTFLQLVLIFTN